MLKIKEKEIRTFREPCRSLESSYYSNIDDCKTENLCNIKNLMRVEGTLNNFMIAIALAKLKLLQN